MRPGLLITAEPSRTGLTRSPTSARGDEHGVVNVLAIVVLPAVVAVGSVFVYAHLRLRRVPFPLAVVPDLTCPFCGHEMRHGRIMHAGSPVWWEPSAARRPRVWVSMPGSHPTPGAKAVFNDTRMTLHVRGANVCDPCEAVVIDPR